ncbi:MAG TPA: hypothetical protein VHS59_03655 [Bacillota bacterium]|nr:hypothetical protein [Bacillota bacterium]
MKNLSKVTVLLFLATTLLAVGCVNKSPTSPAGPDQELRKTVSGGKVAYVQQGQLFVRDIATNQSVQISAYRDVKYPSWSPNGKWLLFQRGRQLWVSGSDGALSRLVSGEAQSSTWIIGQDAICYSPGEGGLIQVSPKGGSVRNLLKPEPGVEISRIMPSPDGRYLALEIWGQTRGDSPLTQGIWKLELKSGHTTPVSQAKPSPGQILGSRPRLAGWSADGQTIFFWNASESASVTADGVPFSAVRLGQAQQEQQGLPPSKELDIRPEPKGLVHGGWLRPGPKGQVSALITGTGRETWNNKQLTLMNLETLQTSLVSQPGMSVNSFSFDFEGKVLAFSAGREEKRFNDGGAGDFGSKAQQVMADRHLYLSSLDGKNLSQLTRDSVYRDEYPVWNARNDHLLFARVDAKQNASLWTIGKDGSQLTQVVPHVSPFDWFGYYGYVDWQQYFDYLP